MEEKKILLEEAEEIAGGVSPAPDTLANYGKPNSGPIGPRALSGNIGDNNGLSSTLGGGLGSFGSGLAKDD